MAKKYKRMTVREKKQRAETRAELRKKGYLPPVKPRLNRKKFAKEVVEEFKNDFGSYSDIRHLYTAIYCMIPTSEIGLVNNISPEQVGVLKVLKLAMEIKKFNDAMLAKGETEYTIKQLHDEVIAPILNL